MTTLRDLDDQLFTAVNDWARRTPALRGGPLMTMTRWLRRLPALPLVFADPDTEPERRTPDDAAAGLRNADVHA